MRVWVYDVLSLAAFSVGIFALIHAVRLLAGQDYVGALVAVLAGFVATVASSELFRFAMSVWVTERRRDE